MTSRKVQYVYYQWQIMEIQASSFATSDNDSFPSAFVEYSTDMYSSVDHGISDTYLSSGWPRSTRII